MHCSQFQVALTNAASQEKSDVSMLKRGFNFRVSRCNVDTEEKKTWWSVDYYKVTGLFCEDGARMEQSISALGQ